LQSADKSSQNFVSTSCDWKPPSSHTLLLVTLGENNMADAQTGEMGMMIMWRNNKGLTWCKVTIDLCKKATILQVLFCRT